MKTKDLDDEQEILDNYFNLIMDKFSKQLIPPIDVSHIVDKKKKKNILLKCLIK